MSFDYATASLLEAVAADDINVDIRGGKTMTQGKPSVRSGSTGVECAVRQDMDAGTDSMLAKQTDHFSRQWIFKFLDPSVDRNASYGAAIASSRLLKFLVVGGIGVFVNLGVMALLIQAKFAGDWRASAFASAVGALSNYLLNNHWTFSDRRRNGRALLNGALMYFPMSAVAIGITTLSYSILSQARFRASFGTSSLYLLGAQLVSIGFGTYFNYTMHRAFTWRLDRDQL